MKAKLNLGERIGLLAVLPTEANFITLKVLRALKETIGIKEEEFKKYGIKQEGEQVKWNDSGIVEVEFEIGDKAEEIIIEALEDLNRQKKLTENHFSLYEKFNRGSGELEIQNNKKEEKR